MHVSLYRQDVVLEHPVRASGQNHEYRSRLFVRLDDEGVAGYGEVAPQPDALNGDPGWDDVLSALRVALERLVDVLAREGELPPWGRVTRLGSASAASNVASALIEMAVLDRELRRDRRLVRDLWPARFDTPQQSTVSLLDDDTEWVIDDDVQRVRVKCAPGPLSEIALDRLARLEVPVLVDYNCSANEDDDVLSQVERMRDVATIVAVEQPYDVGNLVDHARLARKLDVALSIDEGVRSTRDLIHISNYEAATMVCVKPARVGGLANARTMIATANELHLRVYLGGFFESAYARHVHRALANSCVEEPSDLAVVAYRDERSDVERVDFGFGVAPSTAMLATSQRLSLDAEIGS